MFKLLFSVIKNLLILGIIAGVGWAGYNYFLVEETPPPPLPNLSGYKTVEGQDITSYIASLGDQAAELTNQPLLANTVERIDEFIGCYQDVGAVQSRIYSSEESPLSSGFVAIADRNQILDPVNLYNCVAAPQLESQARSVSIDPCTANYSVERDNNEFYIIYAGTTEEICQAFCAQLEGCTAHK